MAKPRICMICGTSYKYCPNCGEYNSEETWRFLFHDETCKAIYEIWDKYRGKKLSKEDAAQALKCFDLTKIFASNSIVIPDLKEMLDIKDEVEDIVIPNEAPIVSEVAENKDDEVVVEEVKEEKPFKYQKHNRNKK